MKSIIFGTILMFLIPASFGKLYKVQVRGRVICNGDPVPNVEIQLREHDTFDPDDVYNVTRAGWKGEFRLKGQESEVTKIKPYLRISHQCDVVEKNCHRDSDYDITSEAVNFGKDYPLPDINLKVKGQKDEKICV